MVISKRCFSLECFIPLNQSLCTFIDIELNISIHSYIQTIFPNTVYEVNHQRDYPHKKLDRIYHITIYNSATKPYANQGPPLVIFTVYQH